MKALNSFLSFISTFIRVRWGMRFKNRAQLMRYQQRAMTQHRQIWWPRSDFYHPYLSHPNDVPLMNKACMMTHFNALNTVGIDKQHALDLARHAEQTRDFSTHIHSISVGLSSGTSGLAGIFLASPIEQARWAAIILAKLLPRPFYKPQRIALFLRANNHLYEKLNRSRWIRFRFFDLAIQIDAHIQHLNQLQPSILVAPAQCLEQLAWAQKNGILTIAPLFIYSVAEVLPADVRTLVERTWAKPVFEIYQATEGFLAASCAHGRLHLNEAFVHFELDFLDAAQQRFCPIITDFSRTSQLMVRYRLDDILHLSTEQNCPCGQHSLIIDRIEGRCDDVLYLPDTLSTRGIAVYPDYLSRALLLNPQLIDFRITQISPTCLRIQWVGSVDEADIRLAIEKVLVQHGISTTEIELQLQTVNAFEKNPMHKRRRVVGLKNNTTTHASF